ncbi:MAG TPA: hypothetical protein VK116_07005, partial [Planctomycetota bacterium]|nr:hypothetical protein [Planctomycetota bacterium]
WVRLRDGRRGRVVRQTPESVELCPPGGGLITYRTLDFLAENPQNLSKGFRIDIVFRIDHCHREAATTKIPQKMREYLVRRIPMFVPEEMLVDVRVELREAGPSSLDYEIEIDLGGGAAPHYEQVERGAIGILLDAANENGWKIPFHQIALHQAP